MVARTGGEGWPAGEGGAGEAVDGGGGGGHGNVCCAASANDRTYVSPWSTGGLALISRLARAAGPTETRGGVETRGADCCGVVPDVDHLQWMK